MPTPETALPGRDIKMPVPPIHEVLSEPLTPPFAEPSERIVFGMGCFWGAERVFWQTPGVVTTAVGYSAGLTKNPTYEEVCSGLTGHNEVVLVVYNPELVDFANILTLFWETMTPPRACVREMTLGLNIDQVFMSPTNSSEAWPNQVRQNFKKR